MKVWPSFAVSCCTKTPRQNSYMYQLMYDTEPVCAFTVRPVRSNGSSLRLVTIGQSTLTVLPNHPDG